MATPTVQAQQRTRLIVLCVITVLSLCVAVLLYVKWNCWFRYKQALRFIVLLVWLAVILLVVSCAIRRDFRPLYGELVTLLRSLPVFNNLALIVSGL
jgi:uncharacterized membrane protein YidH (DUF202 family)